MNRFYRESKVFWKKHKLFIMSLGHNKISSKNNLLIIHFYQSRACNDRFLLHFFSCINITNVYPWNDWTNYLLYSFLLEQASRSTPFKNFNKKKLIDRCAATTMPNVVQYMEVLSFTGRRKTFFYLFLIKNCFDNYYKNVQKQSLH